MPANMLCSRRLPGGEGWATVAMKFGLLCDFRNAPPAGKSFANLYAETLEQIKTCERWGWDAIWVTEHHFTDDGYLPSLDVAAGAIAAVTERVLIGHYVLLLPLHHPLEVAENGAVVDILSNGRYRFGPGLGYKLDEYANFGVNRKHRPSIMDESMEIITRAWTQERFSFSGRHFQMENVSVTPKPVQRPRPPILMAARGDKPLARAVKYADGLLGGGGAELVQRYLGMVRAAGKDPAQQTIVGGAGTTIITGDPERAWAEAELWIRWRAERYGQWYGEAGDLPGDDQMGRNPGLAGLITDTATLTARIRQLEAAGYTEVIWFNSFPGYPPSKMLPTFEAIAREVMPHFR